MYNIYKYAIINNERWNNMAQIYRKKINRSRRKQTRYLKDMIEKRYAFITIFVLILFSIIAATLLLPLLALPATRNIIGSFLKNSILHHLTS